MVTIEQAAQDNIELLYDLADQAGRPREKEYFETCLKGQSEGKYRVFLARRNDRYIACCILNWQPKYAFYKRLGIPEIQDLNVIPEMRRQGIATKLITYCAQTAKQAGKQQIGISFGLDSSYGPAQRLYIKLGYIPDGYGATCDRQPVSAYEMYPFDGNMCLMLVKDL